MSANDLKRTSAVLFYINVRGKIMRQ